MSQTLVLADVVYISKTILCNIIGIGVWAFSWTNYIQRYIDQIATKILIFFTKILTVLNTHAFPTLTFKKDLAALIQ